MVEIITKNERETKKVAGLMAKEIIKKPLKIKGALVIGLEGELGSGKTRFVQGFAKGLGIKQRLTSPTFVLIKKYRNLYHIDCYRLNKPKELLDLDFEEIIDNPKNIILIEWAEKVRKILPKDTIWIKFRIISEKERLIVMKLVPMKSGRNKYKKCHGKYMETNKNKNYITYETTSTN